MIKVRKTIRKRSDKYTSWDGTEKEKKKGGGVKDLYIILR